MEEQKNPVEASNEETIESIKAKYDADLAAMQSRIDSLSAQLIERNKTIQELLDGNSIPRAGEDEDMAEVMSKLRFVNT